MNKLEFLILGLVLLSLSACGSPFYLAAPIDAQVIDSDTHQPIEGAIVVANWQLVVGSLDGERYRGQLEVKETVTDKSGHFHFKGFIKLNPMLYELRDEDPKITIFKPGYEHRIISNNYPQAGTETPGFYRKLRVSDGVVRLDKLKPVSYGTRNSYYFGLGIQIEHVVKDCGWKKIPRMIIAMDTEKRAIKRREPFSSTGLIGIDNLNSYSWLFCGSPEAFFKDNMKLIDMNLID